MRLAGLLLVLWTTVASAQSAPDAGVGRDGGEAPTPPGDSGGGEAVGPEAVGADLAPSQPAAAPTPLPPPPPPGPIRPIEVKGSFIDDPRRLKVVLAPEVEQADPDLQAYCARLGYHLHLPVNRSVEPITLELEPLRMVRRVDVETHQSWRHAVFDTDLKRRISLRPGTYLKWGKTERAQQLGEDEERLREYLKDDGFWDARVVIRAVADGVNGATVKIEVDLGPPYTVGNVQFLSEQPLDTPDTPSTLHTNALREVFVHRAICLGPLCFTRARYSKTQYLADIKKIEKRFKDANFPGAKVTGLLDDTSQDRRTRTLNFPVRINRWQHVTTVFEGILESEYEAVEKRLTFAESASSDDFEIAASAEAIRSYYQGRGYFDAFVTWERKALPKSDQIIFRIDKGRARRVRGIDFRITPTPGATTPVLTETALRSKLATQVYRAFTLIGDIPAPTVVSLDEDVERLRRAYAERGYFNAEVVAQVAPNREAFESAALAAGLVAANRNLGDLWVRFAITEGPRTVLDQIEIRGVTDPALCKQILDELASPMGVADLAARAIDDPCIAKRVGIPSLGATLEAGRNRLRDWFFTRGKARATVNVIDEPLRSDSPGTVAKAAVFLVQENQELRIGKVLVRGNFRTRRWIITDELQFREGSLLNADLYARGSSALRQTQLFDQVNVELLETERSVVHVLATVIERSDARLETDFELGLSTYKGAFVSVKPVLPNMFGLGMRLTLEGTAGAKGLIDATFSNGSTRLSYASIEGSLGFPRWLARRAWRKLTGLSWAWDTQLGALWRVQETPRFGRLTTKGASVTLSHVWNFPRTKTRPASALSWTIARYDIRQRNRDDAAIRVPGANIEVAEVPVPTITGSIAGELLWDRRTDRDGNLNPLAPQRGFSMEGGLLYAGQRAPFFGQDSFIKAFAETQVYKSLGPRIVTRLYARLDQGFPLGNAALLPEVERFFAGGATTVRGYAEDLLGKELIEDAIPPFNNVSSVRVLPAGGNIRSVASLEAQVRLAEAKFPLASGFFLDAGLVRNTWRGVEFDDIRPSAGIALIRWLIPVGSLTLDYAIPLRPQAGDDPLGRIHFSVALRN